MEDYIKELNQQQQDAVLYLDGPQLVIAGAGSGKTRVLTYKIVHLLNHGYEPWRILALTFTNKAAREMRERIESVAGGATASKLWMGTFHSIFARILRINAERLGFKSDFTIYDSADSKALIKSIMKDLGIENNTNSTHNPYNISFVSNAISMAKNALISPTAYANNKEIIDADRRAMRPRMAEIYRGYCHRCFVAGAMDFDDLLYYTNVLLRDNPDILRHYQEYFRYVLVDEYQDTNFAQHLIISQLTRESHNLCVVGDDAQSIYSFRGANIRNILNLRNAYPDLKIFKLEQSYRSTQTIINAANSLIEKNSEQIKKQVFSKNDTGSKIDVVQSFSDYEEAFLVANRISQVKMQTHDSYDEFAILYRTNAQSRILEESLRKRNIPYRIYGGLSFYQRKEVKNAIAYFRLSINPNDDEALKRIINFPTRGIGDTTVNKLIRCAIDNKTSIWNVINNLTQFNPSVNSGTAKKLIAFRDLIQSFIELNNNGNNAEEVVKRIIRETQLLSILLSDNTPENISKQENLHELLNGVKEFVSNKLEEGNTENISLTDFLTEVSLATDQDTQDEENGEQKLKLMTVHAAKGLEFNNVFIVGVEEGYYPSGKSELIPFSEVEENRRLLYVAITRAKNNCMITYALSRLLYGQTTACSPSSFIKDIDTKYLNLCSGTAISGNNSFTNPVDNYRKSFHSETKTYYAPRNLKPLKNTNGTSASSRTIPSGNPSYSDIHKAENLSVGMIIEHQRFGTGKITTIDTSSADARIIVEFANTGTKTLLLKFAHFKIIG